MEMEIAQPIAGIENVIQGHGADDVVTFTSTLNPEEIGSAGASDVPSVESDVTMKSIDSIKPTPGLSDNSTRGLSAAIGLHCGERRQGTGGK